MKKSFLVILLFFLLARCTTSANSEYFTSSNLTNDIFAGIPKKSKPEVKYGYQVYLAILSDQSVILQGRKNERVQTIAKKLIPHVERAYFPYTVTVLTDDRVFASSTPGGFIYVSEGMVDFCIEDDHLAAVIAQELGQIQHKRMRYTMKKRLMNFLQSSASSSSIAMGPAGVVVPKGIKVLNNVVLREKSRVSRTMEADSRAIVYLRESGYTIDGLLVVLRQIATIEGKDYYKFKDYSELRPISAKRLQEIKLLMSDSN